MAIINAVALPLVMLVAKWWTSLYARVAPGTEASTHQSEVLSNLDDLTCNYRASGYRPPEVAVRLILHAIPRLASEVAWFTPHLPTALADRLDRGSDRLLQLRTPTRLISSIAGICLMNWALYLSEDDLSAIELSIVNAGLAASVVVMWNLQNRWARRMLYLYLCLATIVTVTFLALVVLQYHLYQGPLLYQYALATLPVLLAIVVGSRELRRRIFRDRWWPVAVTWMLLAALSLGTAVFTDGITTLLTVWGMMGTIVLVVSIVTASVTLALLVMWHRGLWVCAYGMRLVASGVLHSKGNQTRKR